MEEVLVRDDRDGQDHSDVDDGDEEMQQAKRKNGCASPRTTQMHEVVDALTLDCFSFTVAPLVSGEDCLQSDASR